ncbi:MAG: hypothetical protein MJ123_05005 [Lachnospiraceae bacterium]|nr:hypothetical protein [Lachnospiraceae bacterium]
MKKSFIIFLMLCLFTVSLSACRKENNDSSVNEEIGSVYSETKEDIISNVSLISSDENETSNEINDTNVSHYSNWLEEAIQKNSFNTIDDIISSLESPNAYAIIDISDSEDKAILVTSATYDYEGSNASISAYLYVNDKSNNYVCEGMISSDSTSTPLTIDTNGYIYSSSHSGTEKYAIVSKDNSYVLTLVEGNYIDFSSSDEGSYSGIIDGNVIEGDEAKKANDRLVSEVSNSMVIDFIVIE